MQCMLNSRREIVHTNIKIPHEVKITQYFQLSGFIKKISRIFFQSYYKVKIQDTLYRKKFFGHHKTRPIKRAHFDAEFPPFDNGGKLFLFQTFN